VFKEADSVVHPAHGVGVIREIQDIFISGRKSRYYVIEFPLNEIDRVLVPVDNADNVGLRPVVGDVTIEEVLRIVTDTEGRYINLVEDESFHKRHKEYVDRVQSGDILQVARVFKTLLERSRGKDLGLKEKFLMERAEKMILGELAFSREISLENAREILISSKF